MMRAAILSIGDELALGQTLDTNGAWLAEQLVQRGFIVDEHRTIADDRGAIARAIGELSSGRNVLVITGGLGPTIDDLTREALGDAIAPGNDLVQDQDALRWLDHWFADRGRTMPQSNLRQTYRPATMRCIPNPHGTAPGLAGRLQNCTIFALPGPPPEMMPMFHDHVAPEMESTHQQSEAIVTGKVNLFGLGESLAAERIADLMSRGRTPLVGITVSGAIISARVRATGVADSMRAMVEADLDEIERRWHPYVFSRDDETLSQSLGRMLKQKNATLATAESCTGGWLGKSIVDVPGSSAYYVGGWVTYSNEMKTQELGVEPGLIEAHGAVSAEVARAMAAGARARSGAEHALAVTGVAGPESSPGKPVGLVYVALATKRNRSQPGTFPEEESMVCGRRFEFTGDRSAIREKSVLAAMQMLRFALLGVGDDVPLLWETKREGALGRI